VPIFTGFLIENRAAEARQQKYQTEQKKIDLTNRIALEVTDAYLTLQAARQQLVVEEKEVESARSALGLAKERYRLGLASIVDVTTATVALLMAEVRLSEARYTLQAGTAAVAYATGQAPFGGAVYPAGGNCGRCLCDRPGLSELLTSLHRLTMILRPTRMTS